MSLHVKWPVYLAFLPSRLSLTALLLRSEIRAPASGLGAGGFWSHVLKIDTFLAKSLTTNGFMGEK
jgi:hypothetical protein